jgi:hypothetical protein
MLGRVRHELIVGALAITAAACVVAATADGAAAARVRHKRVKIVRPAFRRVAAAGRALAAGDLVLITNTNGAPVSGAGGTLIDEVTGAYRRVPH